MEINSSVEELVVKTRKPYTITKQRESWTEGEHNRFLEALKLYGRAWQRIEEHIGTKTAVQIRSHAQKFFTKLEKESVTKGTPLGEAHDIDIPPPRPKRKPSSAYPRKTGVCCVAPDAEVMDEKASTSINYQSTNKQEVSPATKSVQCSVVLNLFEDAPSTSDSSGNKGSTKPTGFREFVPTAKEPEELQSVRGSSLQISGLEEKLGTQKQSMKPQPFPTFPSFAQFHNTQDIYRSYFSSLLVSTLLQNPAVHAAAFTPPSLRPLGEMDSSMDSSSMAAIAAATVAAAASWWASHGLIPFFPPVPATGFTFPPMENTSQSLGDKMEARSGTYRNSSTTDQQAIAVCPENDASNVNNNLKQFSCNNDLDETKISEKTRRSSCCSSTPSSSEIETDAALKDNVEAKDEAEQVHFQCLPLRDFNIHRTRSGGSMNELWKEVSQEGRLAFQALFARDVLPQTFSLQHVKVEMGSSKDMPAGGGKADDNGFLPNKIGGNLKLRRTGFKPYKRCYAEADQDNGSAHDKTCNKRICLGEASSS